LMIDPPDPRSIIGGTTSRTNRKQD
jgi:hypothetical protein